MSSLLARLKANKGQNTKALKERLAQQGQGGFKADERIWKHTWEESKPGEFVSVNTIRFLPVPMVDMERREKGEIPEGAVLTPCACIISHFFEGSTGSKYIEKSLATFDEDCPVRKHDQPLWKQQKETNDEGLKKILMKRLPNTDYYANILVINDAQKPENNGKVFLFKFGRGIKKIIDAAAAPKFPTDPKIEDVFCPWEGADLEFNLTGEKRKFNGRDCISPDYARVTWAKPSALFGGDEAKIEEIWKQTYSLQDFYDRKNFKTYEELEKRFKMVMGIPEDAPLEAQMAVDSSVGAAPGKMEGLTGVEQEEDTPIGQDKGQETDAGAQQGAAETKQEDDGDDQLTEFEKMLKEAEQS
ncbi:single-stranded DNA-binding protein [Vibrio phage VAP7]|uniref:Single-stranded DNA-binding protein n=1 Tax=Vibrio phage VAP7 TaxID=2584487 RepID=A0A4Y5TV41_9CAUD|nr:single-stranded DNA-binding protein [Vibrio phage VAP7]QDB73188.1 single-stranded DNA-binding protein [Vibrio phage VAP7]UFD98127.1 single stranded DNA-binding protein [Vibrio phage BX-1]